MTAHTALNQHNHASIPNQNVPLGALTLFAEIAISIVMAGFIKQVSPETSLLVILFFRYALSLPLLLLFGWFQRGRQLFQVTQKKALIARTISGLLGLCTWFVAVIHLAISTATVLAQLLPVFITLMAPFLIGEKIGLRRLSAVVIGFIGVIVLINPFAGQNEGMFPMIGLIFGLAAPFFAALMFIFLRQLGRQDSPISTSLWYNVVGTIIFGGLIIITGAPIPAIEHANSFIWFVLIFTGVASSFQQFLMAWSHQLAKATTLAPVHYSAVPVAIFIGIVFFDEQLSIAFIAGTTIIIGSAWYIFKREQIRGSETKR